MTCLGCRDSETKKQEPTQVTATAKTQLETKNELSVVTGKSLFDLWQELEHTYRNGQDQDRFSILESLGGGVGMLDFDMDGDIDLCLAGGGTFTEDDRLLPVSTCLQRNAGSESASPFEDRSHASRIALSRFYSHGIAVADYDNDGFSDVLVTGYGGLMLWNNKGDGTFEEATNASGLNSTSWSSSAAWGDLNNDGFVDLYVANYVDWSFKNNPKCKAANGLRDVCPPKDFHGLADQIYFSDGTGNFSEVSNQLGLKLDGKGLGVVLVDLNQDGWLDIYVANDTTANFLFLNQQGNGFEEVAELRGVAYDDRGIPNGSMGTDVFDYNMDGLLDIWVTNYEDESSALYRNVGNCFFIHVSKAAGVTSFGQSYVGFGTVCGDLDLDGDEDILVSNGHVIRHPQRSTRRQFPLLLTNSNGRFEMVRFPPTHYFGQAHEGRGLALGDLNNDGSLDAAMSRLNAKASILKNQHLSNQWLKLRLVGRASNRDAIGATASLITDQRTIVRVIKGGGSYLSSSDKTLHWGFGESEKALRVEIRWPSGIDQEIKIPNHALQLTVVEPTAL